MRNILCIQPGIAGCQIEDLPLIARIIGQVCHDLFIGKNVALQGWISQGSMYEEIQPHSWYLLRGEVSRHDAHGTH
jgi:hypothetical protein